MTRKTLATAIITMIAAHSAVAADFTVNNPLDVIDAAPGNGICNSIGLQPGQCTLRAAIMEANALPGTDNITLTANQAYMLTLPGIDDTGAGGDLDINGPLGIRFLGDEDDRPLVNAAGKERAFHIREGNVTLRGFDIFGGNATLPTETTGGGVNVAFAAGNVTISRMRIFANQARFGGGLYNDGANTTVKDSEIFANRLGGDINETRAGGGIRSRGTLLLDASAVYANEGFNETFTDEAVSVEPGGPGIGKITIINSTISENAGTGLSTNNSESVTLQNVTIAGNGQFGLDFSGANTSLVLQNSIIARNGSDDCQLTIGGTYSTNSFNLDSDESCDLADGISNQSGVDPLLTPLKRRGGFSRVNWPMLGSPAIANGNPVSGSPNSCIDVDQHSVARPQAFGSNGILRCDVGSAELPEDAIFFDSHESL